MFPRHLKRSLHEALADTPVVLIQGPRQCGKTTLAQTVVDEGALAQYLTFDNESLLTTARTDPISFISELEGPVVLDEVQRVPELFQTIKMAVDRNRKPGQFLLTGSANVMLLPRLSDSLAGRIELLSLWPLSQGELTGKREGFIDALFSEAKSLSVTVEPDIPLMERLLIGGYPEVVKRSTPYRRDIWFKSYVTTLLQRDVRQLANIAELSALPRLLKLLATRATRLLNYAALSRDVGLPQTTLKRYLALLEQLFVIQLLPAWWGNLGKRHVKAPKLLINDTGLMAHLQELSAERLKTNPHLTGALLENFVAMELRKQMEWNRTMVNLFHYRTVAGSEVDLVLEDRAGRLVGIEIKAGAGLTANDFRGLRNLSKLAGERFHRGILLSTYPDSIPFGERLQTLPVSALWSLTGD